MINWPLELIRFLERPVPVFIHLAAGKRGLPPFVCRGYSARADLKDSLIWITILQSQWLRLNELFQDIRELAVLMTAGTDNESYQLKGPYALCQTLSMEDRMLMEKQKKLTSETFPSLAPVSAVSPSSCLAVSLQVTEVYLQTPGPLAGTLLSERGR